jgi:hypothetical protein
LPAPSTPSPRNLTILPINANAAAVIPYKYSPAAKAEALREKRAERRARAEFRKTHCEAFAKADAIFKDYRIACMEAKNDGRKAPKRILYREVLAEQIVASEQSSKNPALLEAYAFAFAGLGISRRRARNPEAEQQRQKQMHEARLEVAKHAVRGHRPRVKINHAYDVLNSPEYRARRDAEWRTGRIKYWEGMRLFDTAANDQEMAYIYDEYGTPKSATLAPKYRTDYLHPTSPLGIKRAAERAANPLPRQAQLVGSGGAGFKRNLHR